MEDTDTKYHAFFGAIVHKRIDHVENELKKIDSLGNYVIAMEKSETGKHVLTNGEHMHFIAQMDSRDYHRFCKRVFIDYYELRGRATAGKPRQYGKVKQIDNLEKMIMYTLKDGNYRSNMEPKYIEELYKQSYKKVTIKSHEEKIMEELQNVYKQNIHGELQIVELRKSIIRYHIENKTNSHLGRTYIDGLVRRFLAYSNSETSSGYKVHEIYNMLYM